MEQYWMDEPDVWLIELVYFCPGFPNAIGKQNFPTCKAPTSLWQSPKTYFGKPLVIVVK
jgi:hypothetical protein